MSRDIFKQVGGGDYSAASIPEELFRAWRRGELSDRDYHVGTAAWVAENPSKYPPRHYPPFPAILEAYAERRLSGSESRNHENAKRIGAWMYIMVKYQSENEADLSLLMWCLGKCKLVELTNHVLRLEAAIKEFDRSKLPEFQLSLASRVLRKDHEERMNAVRSPA